MTGEDDREPAPSRWRTWLALAWAIGFCLLYARMVLEERAPGMLRAVGRFLGR